MTKKEFIQKYLRGNRIKLWLIVIFAIVAVFLNLLHPLIFSFLIDNVIDLQPIENHFVENIVNSIGGVNFLRDNLWIGGIVIILVYGLLGVSLYLRGYLSGVVSENICMNLRNDLYAHLQKLPYSYHVKVKTGELVQRCTNDVDQIRVVVGTQFQQALRSIAIIIVASVILWNINPSLTIKAVCLMPFLMIYAIYFYKKNQQAFLASDESDARNTAFIQENLTGIRVIKAFGREKYEIEQFDIENAEHRDLNYAMMKLFGTYWAVSDVICMFQILIVLFAGIFEARKGTLTVGNYFVFFSYVSSILFPIRQLGRILSDIGKSSVAIDRIVEILNEKEEDLTSGITPQINGDITFDHVSFTYEDGKNEILHDVSFKIKKGQTIAIIGPTGSGKSTLVHLLTGLYDYTSGSIQLDNYELRDINKEYLRKLVGIVLQEPFLFSKSIYENIHLNKEDAGVTDVENAARIASVHHVIKDFEEGYATLVGEKGVTLSGGQKQRVAIARTILNDNKVLIFDDSLSAVDTETDADIRHHLKERKKDITTIIITQRISSAMEADQIYVLEKGEITEHGTHAELIEKEGLYKRIYEIQSSYVKEASL